MNNMRRGFTMIELVFVIVIIGILAAVAIPKLANTQQSAKVSVVEAFVGTLNRTVLPTMYVKAIRKDGSINGTGADAYTLSNYVEIPKDIGAVDLTKCQANTYTNATAIITTDLGIPLYCRDGNATHAPRISYTATTDGNTTMQDIWFQ